MSSEDQDLTLATVFAHVFAASVAAQRASWRGYITAEDQIKIRDTAAGDARVAVREWQSRGFK